MAEGNAGLTLQAKYLNPEGGINTRFDTVEPLTPERWEDFETLFGSNGACGGCWCMWWRIARSRFDRQKGEENREAMKALVLSGMVPGIIGYLDEKPVAWCSVAPREDFPVLQRSRVLKPVDELSVWSIVCFFIAKPFRGQGFMDLLIRAAADYAKRCGAAAVEGYPVVPRSDEMPPMLAFTGVPTAFQQAGFVEVARRSPTRPIMRLNL